jgi:hypothetical protein
MRAAFRLPTGAFGNPQQEKSMKARITMLSVMIGAYLVAFGMLAGAVVDRMLFDRQRSAVLRRYEHALRQWHSQQMSLEKATMHKREAPAQ